MTHLFLIVSHFFLFGNSSNNSPISVRNRLISVEMRICRLPRVNSSILFGLKPWQQQVSRATVTWCQIPAWVPCCGKTSSWLHSSEVNLISCFWFAGLKFNLNLLFNRNQHRVRDKDAAFEPTRGFQVSTPNHLTFQLISKRAISWDETGTAATPQLHHLALNPTATSQMKS